MSEAKIPTPMSAPERRTVRKAIEDVWDEIERAKGKFPPFRSHHEGCAIIREEFEELWDEVKKQYNVRDNHKMYHEAKQVAAMAVRFMVDL